MNINYDILMAFASNFIATANKPPYSLKQIPPRQMRVTLTMLQGNMTDMFQAVPAAISSAVPQDMGLVTKQNSSSGIDLSNIPRERKKKRKKVQMQEDRQCDVDCTSIGEKIKRYNLNVQKKSKTEVEGHITLIEEPGSKYLDHETPSSDRAIDITKSITDYLTENMISIDNIVTFGCGGTNINTGRNGEMIRLLEVYLQKPIQWIVYQLHSNELPSRPLVEYFDRVHFVVSLKKHW